MATYAYYCAKCKAPFEELQRSPDDATWPCPVCGTISKRADCSGLPAIRGETVGGSYATSRNIANFQEASQEIDYAHNRAEQREGRELKFTPLYKEGIRRARLAT